MSGCGEDCNCKEGEIYSIHWDKWDKRPVWDEYFLFAAEVISLRSSCLRRKFGAVITKQNNIVGTGYNGAAKGVDNCNEKGLCLKDLAGLLSGGYNNLADPSYGGGICTAVHAEKNAILHSSDKGDTLYIVGKLKDGKYSSSKPCFDCTNFLINAGIKRVVYKNEMGGIGELKLEDLVETINEKARAQRAAYDTKETNNTPSE